MTTVAFSTIPKIFNRGEGAQRMNNKNQIDIRMKVDNDNAFSESSKKMLDSSIKKELSKGEFIFNRSNTSCDVKAESRIDSKFDQQLNHLDGKSLIAIKDRQSKSTKGHPTLPHSTSSNEDIVQSFKLAANELPRMQSSGSQSSGIPSEVDDKSSGSSSDFNMRKGKWTPEEEEYTNRIINDFTHGYLTIAPGTTLRTFLAAKLFCDPMRITKKFAGASSIGKRVFAPCERTPENNSRILASQQELAVLEKRFKQRLFSSKSRQKYNQIPSIARAPSNVDIRCKRPKFPDHLDLIDTSQPLVVRSCKPSYSSKYYGPSTQDIGIPGFCPPRAVYSGIEGDSMVDQFEGEYLVPVKPSSPKKCPPAKCRIDEGYSLKKLTEDSDSVETPTEKKMNDDEAGNLLMYFSKSMQSSETDAECSKSVNEDAADDYESDGVLEDESETRRVKRHKIDDNCRMEHE